METTEKTMTAEESFKVIDQMIRSAKTNIAKENSLMYLVWGWLVFIAAIGQYILIKMDSNLNYLPWLILMPIGIIISIILGAKKHKVEKVKTHVDQFLGYLWIAFGVALGMVLFSANHIGIANTLPLVILIYGIGTFVSGGALKFKPLIIGGILCWVIAIIAFQINIELQILLVAASVLVSYIIPGYLLKRKFDHDNV